MGSIEAAGEAIPVATISSIGGELTPDIATYVIRTPDTTVVIDPGPEWHVKSHRAELTQLIDPERRLVAVIQSPIPGCLGGLRGLALYARRRVAVVHWNSASANQPILGAWRVSRITRKAAIRLAEGVRLIIASPPGYEPAGALISYNTQSRTLFSGIYFGSLGPGKQSGVPTLRRESVRAFCDAYTPSVDEEIVSLTFGPGTEVARIAPSHGKPVVGGTELISGLFVDSRSGEDPAAAFSALYRRIAALAGIETATGIYAGSGVPVPDVANGYTRRVSAASAAAAAFQMQREEAASAWLKLYHNMNDWLPEAATAATNIPVARLSVKCGLPVPRELANVATAIARMGEKRASDNGHSGFRSQGRSTDTHLDDLTDEITGLPNERVFRQRLAGQLTEPESPEGNGSVLFVGVDNLRRINASLGRSGGDEALYTCAYLLRNFHSARSRMGTHRLYKLAGPTFAYVLTTGDLAAGTELAEAIRATVAESSMFLQQLTVSIGAVGTEELPHWPGAECAATSDAAEFAVGEIERMGMGRLHVARQSGSNTVCSVEPETASNVATGASVLIADPDAPYLDMLTKQLRERGYTVLVAGDGAQALDVIGQIVPDVIVAEAMLPKLNAFGIREQLRRSAELCEIPFILVSHRKSDEMIEKAAMLGIIHYLQKPFSLVELLGLVRNLSGSDNE